MTNLFSLLPISIQNTSQEKIAPLLKGSEICKPLGANVLISEKTLGIASVSSAHFFNEIHRD